LQPTNALNFHDITDINKGTDINARLRGVINCRGFKYHLIFWNKQGITPMYLNVAMVAPKNILSANVVTPVAFFRANGNQRATNFATLGDTTFQNHVRCINPDDYTILWHKRTILAPNSYTAAGGNMGSSRAIRTFRGYTKLNRQITYDDPESPNATDGRVGLVYWFGRVGDTGLPNVNEVETNVKVLMYYKEPRQ